MLKDANGYIYEKVRRGKIADSGEFTNLKLKVNANGEATITGTYTCIDTNDIEGFGNLQILKSNPPTVSNLKTITFLNKDTDFKVLLIGLKNNDTTMYMVYRNISPDKVNINGLSFDITIDCEIDFNNTMITWD